MVRATLIIDRVLDELKSREADRVKGGVVGIAGVGQRQRLGAQVGKWFKPSPEKRTHGFITLHINTANFPRPIVEIEIGAEIFIFRTVNQLARGSRVG